MYLSCSVHSLSTLGDSSVPQTPGTPAPRLAGGRVGQGLPGVHYPAPRGRPPKALAAERKQQQAQGAKPAYSLAQGLCGARTTFSQALKRTTDTALTLQEQRANLTVTTASAGLRLGTPGSSGAPKLPGLAAPTSLTGPLTRRDEEQLAKQMRDEAAAAAAALSADLFSNDLADE